MNKAAIYHRPESEFAYLYAKNLMHVRLQTQKSNYFMAILIRGKGLITLKHSIGLVKK